VKLRMKAATLAAGLLAIAGGSVAMSAPAMADDPGINLVEACWVQYNDDWDLVSTGDNAFSWGCQRYEDWSDTYSDIRPIDMSRACRWQYGDSFRADFNDFNRNSSWYCHQ
jgi:hypothetical protein